MVCRFATSAQPLAAQLFALGIGQKYGLTPLTTNADTNSYVQFLDTNAPLFNQRFYLTVPQ